MKQCIPKLNLIVLYYQISVDIFLLVKLEVMMIIVRLWITE